MSNISRERSRVYESTINTMLRTNTWRLKPYYSFQSKAAAVLSTVRTKESPSVTKVIYIHHSDGLSKQLINKIQIMNSTNHQQGSNWNSFRNTFN